MNTNGCIEDFREIISVIFTTNEVGFDRKTVKC